MSLQVQACLENAEECDRMASIAADADTKARFADAAQRWRDTARRIERLEGELAED
jgi:hypothetical protein